ncbi:contractile injection system tape measure protein [Algoriphagus namhaensis]
MRNAAQHQIDRLVVHLLHRDQERAIRSQEHIARLQSEALFASIGKAMEETFPGPYALSLKSLEIDLGRLSQEELDTNLPELVRKALQRALEKLREESVSKNRLSWSNDLDPSTNFELQAFLYFLVQGYFPTWYSPQGTVEDMISYFFSHSKQELVSGIKKYGAVLENFRRRIVSEFTSSQLDLLIRQLQPADAAWILSMRENLRKGKVSEQIQPGERLPEKVLNLFILKYLLVESGSRFNRISFTRSLFLQISSHYAIDFRDLIRRVFLLVDAVKSTTVFFREFHETISRINSQEKQGRSTETEKVRQEQNETWKLLFASLGWTERKFDFQSQIYNPEQLLCFLFRGRKTLISQLTEKQLAWIINLLPKEGLVAFQAMVPDLVYLYHTLPDLRKVSQSEFVYNTLREWLRVQNVGNAPKLETWLTAALHANFDSDIKKWVFLESIRQSTKLRQLDISRVSIDLAQSLTAADSSGYSASLLNKPEFSDLDPRPTAGVENSLALLKPILAHYLALGKVGEENANLSLRDLGGAMILLLKAKDPILKDWIREEDPSRLAQLLLFAPLDLLSTGLEEVYPGLEEFVRTLVLWTTSQNQAQVLFKNLLLQLRSLQDNPLAPSPHKNHYLILDFLIANRRTWTGEEKAILRKTPPSQIIYSDLVARIAQSSMYFGKASSAFFLSNWILAGGQTSILQPVQNSGLQVRLKSLKAAFLENKVLLILKKLQDLPSNPSIQRDFRTESSQLKHTMEALEMDLSYLATLAWHPWMDPILSAKKRVEKILPTLLMLPSDSVKLLKSLEKGGIPLLLTLYFHSTAKMQGRLRRAFKNEVTESDFDLWEKIHAFRRVSPRGVDFFNQITNSLDSLLPNVSRMALWRELVWIVQRNKELNSPRFKDPNSIFSSLFQVISVRDRETLGSEELDRLSWLLDQNPVQIEECEIWIHAIKQLPNWKNSSLSALVILFEAKQTKLRRKSTGDATLWIETYEHWEKKGFLPWWSPTVDEMGLLTGMISRLAALPQESQKILFSAQLQNSLGARLFLLSEKDRQELMARNKGFLVRFFPSLEDRPLAKRFLKAKSSESPESVRGSLADLGKSRTNSSELTESLKAKGANYQTSLEKIIESRDEKVVLHSLFKNSQLLSFLKPLLSLSPYFWVGNLNPGRWRLLVFSYGWEQMLKGTSPRDYRFFFNYLIQRHGQYSWKSVFLSRLGSLDFATALDKKLKRDLEDYLGPELKAKEEGVHLDEREPISIANGGVVLCWPFLSTLFSRLEYTSENKFIDHEKQQRAALLIQFIAFGRTDFPEYELILNKILTGMPVVSHLDTAISLTEHEKELALSLFGGIRSNWEKMKNGSTSAIQETFMQRRAHLTLDHGPQMLLEIEPKGVDILLDSLPWGLSMVKLPWMEKGLEIKWR